MKQKITDENLERMVSILLRSGVFLSGAVVLAGGLYDLIGHGSDPAAYRVFNGQPAIDRVIGHILGGAAALRARSLIQLGVVLLIATPIARVVLSLVGFAFERDRTYVVITAIVLSVLLFSLISGAMQG